MKRFALLTLGLAAIVSSPGCCCWKHDWFASTYQPAPTYYSSAPAPTYYAAPPTAAAAPPRASGSCSAAGSSAAGRLRRACGAELLPTVHLHLPVVSA